MSEWSITPVPAPDPASPYVIQFMTDYTYVRDELLRTGSSPRIDTGMGEADLVLSIVNDSYAHNRMNKARALPPLHAKEVTQDEMQELIDGISELPCDNG